MSVILQQLEESVIKLIAKIKSSLLVKTFLSIFFLLLLCCSVMFIFISISVPRVYHDDLANDFNYDLNQLVTHLETHSVDESNDIILQFAQKNNTSLKITDDLHEDIFTVNNSNESNLSDQEHNGFSQSFSYQDKLFTIFVFNNFESVNSVRSSLVKIIPIVIGIVLIISVISAYYISRHLTKPLVELSEISNKISKLDLTWKCDTTRSDEIGILSRNLNYMGDALQRNLVSLEKSNNDLKGEVEKTKKLELQRYNFFTAVSHELKTPITIMNGELEGMIHHVGEYKNRDLYLRHVLKTNKQLESLVSEILAISKMENEDFKLNQKEINVANLIQETMRPLLGIAEDKDIKLTMTMPHNFNYFGDYELLKKAFENILLNAIQYSDFNADVKISIDAGIVTVLNTDAQLPYTDDTDLFQPFYRTDSTHIKKTGGSGLGLYIVKIYLRNTVSYSQLKISGIVSYSPYN